MAFIVDQQSRFKHFCKICKKGFGCGRALGGHMRAHGIGDESGSIDDDDPASDWEDKLGGTNVTPPSNKRMYALRMNPNRLKSCRVCENCGKEFLSWKSFLEHGKCSSENAAESLVSSPPSTDDGSGGGVGGVTRRGCSMSKRKRSLRPNMGHFNSICPSSEEEDLANCLMMLSNATVDPFIPETEAEESCASASKEDQERRNTTNFVAPIACRVAMGKAKGVAKGVAKGLFACKACKKVFNSHQALGGHRASHKKVKGCFAAKLGHHTDDSQADEDHDVITNEEFYPTKSSPTLQFDEGTSKRKSKLHECSICRRVFSSGQALGGHKRCHWVTSNSPDASSLAKFHHQFQDDMVMVEQIQRSRRKFIDQNSDDQSPDLKLDLNLPAPTDHHTYDIKVGRNHVNPSSLDDVATEIYLQPWIRVDAKEKPDINQHQLQVLDNDKNNNCSSSMQNGDYEADSKVKLAKLSQLKDINVSGGSSPWLQVGIGSTTNVGSGP